jgi:hypothetical protein
MPSLMTVASDFRRGRNPMYCYFGQRFTVPSLLIEVDSVTVARRRPRVAASASRSSPASPIEALARRTGS